MAKRDGFVSRFGVLVTLAGSAVGLGNLWRFPYLVGQNGGAAFILIYILFVIFLCFPIFISEFIIGRRSQTDVFTAFSKISGDSRWNIVGALTVLSPLLILSYYSVIGGWSVNYLFKAVNFEFTNTAPEQIESMFTGLISSVDSMFLYHTLFILATAVVVLGGVKGGIEKFSKIMMPALFLIMLAIALYSLTLENAWAGVEFLFRPDFSKLTIKSCAAALGQAFFSLSLGFGTILTYGSYVSKKENILFQSSGTVVFDTLFALIAGLAIMPAVFNYGLSPQEGPGLVFHTLPYVFSQMPAGGAIAVFFFLALFVAAITSSISMFEVVVAYFVDEKKLSRILSCLIVFIIAWLIGILCLLSFGPLADLKIFGLNIFDFLDKTSSNFLMTIGSFCVVIFVGWKMKKSDIYDEFTNGGTLRWNVRLFGILYFIIRYLAPVVITLVFLSNFIL